jgi:hypothetical protein
MTLVIKEQSVTPQAIDPVDICAYLSFSALVQYDLLLPQARVDEMKALNSE